MTPERWRQVTEIFHAALTRDAEARPRYLDEACADDAALRAEVNAMLSAHGAGAQFGETPVNVSTVHSPRLAAGTTIGSYRIERLIGTGGMGEVYRARDTKLGRDVAIKVLPAAFSADADRLARFEREARVLAALNHPHIAAIHSFEEREATGAGQPTIHALVLELVEGPMLAQRLTKGPIPIKHALDIARQIAEALEAAHGHGIIHRDLKPANIKLTRDGVVKVLDFGLAKAFVDEGAGVDLSQVPTLTVERTQAGLIAGTPAYMSPEQARGQTVDKRTDIWSFGCVLFEMLTGVKVFAADLASDSIAKILEGEPDWNRLPTKTPASVRQLLRRCLQKDPGKRPQTIAEARAVIEHLLAPRTSWRTWAAIAAAAILAISAGTDLWLRADRTPLANRADWVQITNLDSATQPALSADGRMLAFIRGPNTFISPGQLYVKPLPDGDPVALTNDTLPKMSPAFSLDGSRIAYTVHDGNSWDTWEVPTLRGEPTRWLRNASGLTWTGANALLFSEVKTGIHMAIVKSTEDRAESRDLYVPPHTSGMAHRSYVSPDGKWVLVVEMDEKSVWLPCRLLPSDGGASQPVGPSKARCTDAAWSPDGRWMYFSANAGDGFHVWRQRFRDGAPEQLTFGPTEEQGLAVAADGKSLITSVGLVQRSVWLRDASGERQISLEGYAFWPLLSADGRRLLFRVTRSFGTAQSPSELWMVELGSGQKHRLFPSQLVTGYDVSRDDRVVAAVVERDGRTRVWLAWLDGREPPRRIAQADGDHPRFGRPGEILFRASEGDTDFLYRIRENGEDREEIARIDAEVIGTASPDGEWLSSVDATSSQTLLYSTSGQASRPLFPYSQSSRLRWSPDGRRAYFSIQFGAASAFAEGRTYVLPLAPGSVLPVIPPRGFRTEAEIAAVPGVEILPYGDVALGLSPSVYAFSRVITTRNLYRIPLP